MGVFDGVHRGHRAVLEVTRAAAFTSVAIVFDPHPDEVIRGIVIPRLAPPTVNLERIRAVGIDFVLPLHFDDGLRALRPEEFLDAIAPAIEIRTLVMTRQSAFGKGRTGTAARMAEIGPERGFEVVAIEPQQLDGEVVSSSRVRAAIGAGDLEAATELLGCAPYLEGTVVVGDRRGRELGFPTANLAFGYLPALPPLGIYVGRVAVPERGVGPGHPALVSVGVRPTFHSQGDLLVEVNLLDWDGDLYGARLQLDLLTRLRDERRFDGVNALIAQMRRDEADARRRLDM